MALIPLLGFCGYPQIKLTRGLTQIYRTSLVNLPGLLKNSPPVIDQRTPETRYAIDTSAGGTIMTKTPGAIKDLIENLAINHYQWPNERAMHGRTHSTPESDAMATLVAKIESLNASFEENIAQITKIPQQPQDVPNLCVVCGGQGHDSTMCPSTAGLTMEELNALQVQPIGQYRVNDLFSPTYNSGWRNHPHLSYKNNQPPPIQQQQPPPQQQVLPPQPQFQPQPPFPQQQPYYPPSQPQYQPRAPPPLPPNTPLQPPPQRSYLESLLRPKLHNKIKRTIISKIPYNKSLLVSRR
ncbi:hypothetical protein OSB04_023571 [Centaurea solstitialis]|uniref:Uncharacterized protein n=1 Tax=Centaurea solstitialis TaxID=347529 RepID=A0AA38SL51_9ASTR|nr:hypothetical protein OSB04_023571 [Centaurea solstitialis]